MWLRTGGFAMLKREGETGRSHMVPDGPIIRMLILMSCTNHHHLVFVSYPPVNEHKPWQLSGLEDKFPLYIGHFQGPTVNLPEGI